MKGCTNLREGNQEAGPYLQRRNILEEPAGFCRILTWQTCKTDVNICEMG
jgi:hypothetical protein